MQLELLSIGSFGGWLGVIHIDVGLSLGRTGFTLVALVSDTASFSRHGH